MTNEESRINYLIPAIDPSNTGLSSSDMMIRQMFTALMAFVPLTNQPNISISILENIRTLVVTQPYVRQLLTNEDNIQLFNMIERAYTTLDTSIKASSQTSNDHTISGSTSGGNNSSNNINITTSNSKSYKDMHTFIEASGGEANE